MRVLRDLYAAIKEHVDLDDSTIKDAARYGADGGFAGFTYYTDTCEFYEKNERLIWDLLEEEATAVGANNCLELIASFGGAKDVYGADQFKNLLAWFALEQVGRWLEDNPSEGSEEEEEEEEEEEDREEDWTGSNLLGG